MVIEGTHYSPKCFCKNCKKIKIMDEKVSLRNEWNLALLRYAEKVGTEDAPESRRKIVTDISQAIATAVANREKEIAEEVEKYALYCQKESAEQLERENVMLAYDMDSRQVAAKKILQILKH